MAESFQAERYLLPTGTVVHIGGFPVELEGTVIVIASKGNWGLISEAMDFPPLSSEPVTDGQVSEGEASHAGEGGAPRNGTPAIQGVE